MTEPESPTRIVIAVDFVDPAWPTYTILKKQQKQGKNRGPRIDRVVDLKLQLIALIRDEIVRLELTQWQAGRILGLGQPKVSSLVRGKLGQQAYSIDRLVTFLDLLDIDVEIVAKRKRPPANR